MLDLRAVSVYSEAVLLKKPKKKSTKAKKKPAKKTKPLTPAEKRTYGIIAAVIGAVCILLLTVNFFLLPRGQKKNASAPQRVEPTAQNTNQSAETKTSQKIAAQEEAESSFAPKVKPEKTPCLEKNKPPAQKTETIAHAQKQKTAQSEVKPAPHAKEKKIKNSEPAVKVIKERTAAQNEKKPVQPAQVKKQEQQKPVQEKKLEKPKPVQPAKKEPVAVAARPEKPPVPKPHKGTLIFVFDDAGHNLAQLQYFLRLPFPCTIAVLPRLAHSAEAARRIRAAGKECILHQPMQAINPNVNPGQGAIKPGMTAAQIRETLNKNIEELWPIAGMNNHEGSLITADENAMQAVLDTVAEKHIYFLDSRTNVHTVVPRIAKERNMVIWERSVFIDNDKNRKAMENEIKKGLKIAEQRGCSIMIGHVFTVELAELLTEMYPTLVEEGYSLSTIAQFAANKIDE